MDQVLRERNLGSASARRKKMRDREVARQLDEERRTRILLYGYSSSDDSSDGGDTYSPIADVNSDRALSISTVSNYASIESPSKQTFLSSYSLPPTVPPKSYIPELSIPQPLSPDFLTFHAESILPTADANDNADADADEDLDLTEPETPIQIATPILYSVPRTRPSMISIKTSTSPTFLRAPDRPVSLPHAPPIPRKSDRRGSAMSLRSVSSRIELPVVPLRSLRGNVPDTSRSPEKSVNRRPVGTTSSRNEPAFQFQVPSYDVFPRRSNLASPRKVGRLMVWEEQPQPCPTVEPPFTANNRRISSFPTDRKYSEPMLSASPPQLHSKKPISTPRPQRSSIGLALRNVSSPFRSKNVSLRPETSSSVDSVGSNEGINISAFPMPPPSPLFRQSFQHRELKVSLAPSGPTRMSRVRNTIGL